MEPTRQIFRVGVQLTAQCGEKLKREEGVVVGGGRPLKSTSARYPRPAGSAILNNTRTTRSLQSK